MTVHIASTQLGHLELNTFSSYSMLEEDVIANSIFTIGQMQVIQNLLAVKAEEKLLLEYDVANPSSFIQQESYHKGQIELLQYLLDNSLACQRLGNESDSSLYNPDIF
tara:strand:- start:4053 stop:4376 length:324 start_codon:yes stop_codon:yes gene_type:complete